MVPSERAEQAAARGAAAARRGQQLRERIARLRAGATSTHEDVALAQASVLQQREEAVRAQERLLRAYASAADLRSRTASRRWWTLDAPPAVREPLAAPADRDRENEVLRHALVSLASSGDGKGGWPKDRRRALWEALSEQCGQESWRGWSRALCQVAPSLLPELRGMAVSGYDDAGASHLLAVTDEWTRELEEVGQLVGDGPGMEAHRTQRPVLVKDLDEDQARWPVFVATAAELGLRTVYALPVQLDGVGLGSLTLYPHDQDGGGWTGWLDGFFLADVAAKTLMADLEAVEDGWPMGEAEDDRIAIATGMLAARLGIPVDEASARLRAFAFSNARGLGEVAEAVRTGTLTIS